VSSIGQQLKIRFRFESNNEKWTAINHFRPDRSDAFPLARMHSLDVSGSGI
jgi:hypothetical protein